jgi:hypothetical protein
MGLSSTRKVKSPTNIHDVDGEEVQGIGYEDRAALLQYRTDARRFHIRGGIYLQYAAGQG